MTLTAAGTPISTKNNSTTKIGIVSGNLAVYYVSSNSGTLTTPTSTGKATTTVWKTAQKVSTDTANEIFQAKVTGSVDLPVTSTASNGGCNLNEYSGAHTTAPSDQKNNGGGSGVKYTDHTRGDYLASPGDNNDLKIPYSTQDILDAATYNHVRVNQNITQESMIHKFKDFVGSDINHLLLLIGLGQSTPAPSLSTVYLQIYNQNRSGWNTIASNNSKNTNTDFTLSASIADLTNYKDASNTISWRVHQLAT